MATGGIHAGHTHPGRAGRPRSVSTPARVTRDRDDRSAGYFADIKASELFVRALENEGVEYVFGVPVEENLDLIDSLRNSSIRVIPTPHEQAAGFIVINAGHDMPRPA